MARSDVVAQGPFGGVGGIPFYDGVGDVVQIVITYSNEVVFSVQANYRQKTADVFNGATHGPPAGPKNANIELDFSQGERLMRVKGTTAPAVDVRTDVVTSLTFITTKKTYGPYGREVGRPFQSSPQGKVVGFFGRAQGFIDSLGTFTEFSQSNTSLIPDGPWGGKGGSAYYDAPADKIQQIDVEYDNATIISLSVTYDRGSQGFLVSKHGGDGSFRGTTETIVFGYDEYLARVTGTTGPAYNFTGVTSLRFITNKRTHGPFGNISRDKFDSRTDTQILSFFGRSGSAIDQLGAFVGEAPSPLAVKVARFGGIGGNPFYEGRGEISQIAVTVLNGRVVAGLQVTYLQGGEQFVGALHGYTPGVVATIPLNPNEYLVQVKGTHGPAEGYEDLIVSIEFITNQKKHGPFGNPSSGTSFASPSAGHIVGLIGRSYSLLDQIGVICFPIKSVGNRLPVAV